MATKTDIIAKAKESILDFDDEAAGEVAKEALAAGVSPAELIEEGFTAAMLEVGEKFGAGKLFLPHVIAAADAMQAAINILTPNWKGQVLKQNPRLLLSLVQSKVISIPSERIL